MSYSIGIRMVLLFVWALSLTMIQGGVVSAAENEPKAGDITRGAQSWAENCMRCHNMRDPREFRDDLWKPIVTHMRVRAGLTGQEARDILAFIQNSN
ncbi:MAG: cytochrome c [Pseudomonadota bacterium]|nr:cytochrome c [Pseudomonadota bacterium]